MEWGNFMHMDLGSWTRNFLILPRGWGIPSSIFLCQTFHMHKKGYPFHISRIFLGFSACFFGQVPPPAQKWNVNVLWYAIPALVVSQLLILWQKIELISDGVSNNGPIHLRYYLRKVWGNLWVVSHLHMEHPHARIWLVPMWGQFSLTCTAQA